jgi:hypothetical protein
MATLLILTHERDSFDTRNYLASSFLPYLAEVGHEVIVCKGIDRLPPADVAWLHVDRTVVPQAYLDALAPYPIVINRKVADIGKRTFSQNLVTQGGPYKGAVIVKTNLNSRGTPEARPLPPYRVLASVSSVPVMVWRNPHLIVEKFLPEQDERGYYLRCWTFLGDHERCVRLLGSSPIVKGRDAQERTPVPVPDALRAWRARLGFDYGKFDFVMHQGAPVLLDVNRTPTIPARFRSAVKTNIEELAAGIASFLP